jgi:hypothetical protein
MKISEMITELVTLQGKHVVMLMLLFGIIMAGDIAYVL